MRRLMYGKARNRDRRDTESLVVRLAQLFVYLGVVGVGLLLAIYR